VVANDTIDVFYYHQGALMLTSVPSDVEDLDRHLASMGVTFDFCGRMATFSDCRAEPNMPDIMRTLYGETDAKLRMERFHDDFETNPSQDRGLLLRVE